MGGIRVEELEAKVSAGDQPCARQGLLHGGGEMEVLCAHGEWVKAARSHEQQQH